MALRARWLTSLACCCAAYCAWSVPAPAQQASVTLQVNVAAAKPSEAGDSSNVVVWLTPLDPSAAAVAAEISSGPTARLIQKNKTFEPHLLVVTVGTAVDFPNQDPFLHNVFSLFDGKRFDLGFYEAGTSRTVHFDRPGASFLFCNIHPQMSAVVVAVPTRYFGISDRAGRVTIANVPDGRYRMEVWWERSLPESLKALTRTVTISSSERTLPTIQIAKNRNSPTNHKNKFGLDYVPPAGSAY